MLSLFCAMLFSRRLLSKFWSLNPLRLFFCARLFSRMLFEDLRKNPVFPPVAVKPLSVMLSFSSSKPFFELLLTSTSVLSGPFSDIIVRFSWFILIGNFSILLS